MKLEWSGTVIGVQPRIRLLRSFDQRTHEYLGFALHLDGVVDGERRAFTVGIGRGAQAKHAFRAGDHASGLGEALADERKEALDLYKVSRLAVDPARASLRRGLRFSASRPRSPNTARAVTGGSP